MLRYTAILASFLFLSLAAFSQVKPLGDYLKAGVENSPLLKDLSNQAQSNSIDSLLIRAGHMPQVKFNGLLYYAPVVNGYGYAEPITNIANLTSVVNVSQNIFVKKTLEAQYEKAGLLNQTLSNAKKITVYDLEKAITAQYLTVFGIFEEIRYNQELFTSMNDEEQVLARFVRAGIYSQTDYLSFQVERQSLELSLNDLRIGYDREFAALNQLCGVTDTASYDLVLPELTVPPAYSRENSPFFRKFRLDSLQLLNERILIDRNYKPVVSWFSDAGMINNDPSIIYKNFGLSLGMSLSLPIYDGNQRKLNYRKIQLTEETRKGYRDYFERQYDRQLTQLTEELRKTRAMIPGIRQQLNTAEMIVRQEKELLNAGKTIPVTDYVIALRNLVTIRHNLVQNQVKVQQVINEIKYWQQTK